MASSGSVKTTPRCRGARVMAVVVAPVCRVVVIPLTRQKGWKNLPLMTGEVRSLEYLLPFRRDFLYYAPRALWIRPKKGPITPFHLNKAQQYVHKRLEEQYADIGMIRALILKGRQQGMSTYVEARFYWRVSGEIGKYAFILTHEDKATNNLFGMVERYHQHCPAPLKPLTRKANAKELKFGQLDSGYLVATAGAKDTGRSATAQLLHGSEVAFWQNAKDHLAGIGQVVPYEPGTEIIFESTANGTANEFAYMWADAERGLGDYIDIFVPWFWEDGYSRKVRPDFALTPEEQEYMDVFGLTLGQMVWRRGKIEDDFRGDEDMYNQEYPATAEMAFQRVVGHTLISAMLVNKAALPKGDQIENVGPKIMGVDVAEMGDDDSTLALRQGRRCHFIRARHGLRPMEVVGWAAMVADEEKPDVINVDATGLGSGVADRLRERGYPVNRIIVGERATDEHISMRLSDEMWVRMRDWFLDEPVEIPDDRVLIGECIGRTFEYDSSGRIVLTSKKKLRSEGLKSPDRGDGLALTFAIRVSPQMKKGRINHRRRTNPRVI